MTDNTMSHEFQHNPDRTGTTLSIIGLGVWLAAMLLAVISPIVGLPVPPMAVVGLVLFSGLFSLLSLPRLLGSSPRNHEAESKHEK
jgi:hypothetical protein